MLTLAESSPRLPPAAVFMAGTSGIVISRRRVGAITVQCISERSLGCPQHQKAPGFIAQSEGCVTSICCSLQAGERGGREA